MLIHPQKIAMKIIQPHLHLATFCMLYFYLFLLTFDLSRYIGYDGRDLGDNKTNLYGMYALYDMRGKN